MREELIDDFIRHCADLFPYDDPNYEEKLLKAAESYADDVLDSNSEFNQLCKYYDEFIENELEY